MNKTNKLYLIIALLLGTSVAIFAQEDEEDDNLDTIDLDELSIVEIPIEENIMPTSRPFNSVYGTNRSILETPRNVTIISREQLDAISIKTPRDFAKLTSSSYTKSNFGAPSTPNLRAQEADMFVNGIRKGLTSNGNGLPINFNSVESVNIVKGPAGVVYGTSNYQGGYADLITKRAYFDATHSEVSATIGSYNTKYWSFDYGQPVNENLAWRISYAGEETDGYYEFNKKNTQALYGTLTYRPNDSYQLDFFTEVFVADYTENWGINRPTQDLIDKGLYTTSPLNDAEYLEFIEGVGGFANSVAIGGEQVKIDRKSRLMAPGDDSYGENFWAQAIQTWNLDNDAQIVNNTYFQWIDRNTFSSYHYSELLRDNWSLDNRTEARFSLPIAMETNVNAGAHFRIQDVWSVNHFNNEPVNVFDLTRDPNTRRIPQSAFDEYPTIPDEPAHGDLDAWYWGGSGQDTYGFIYGPFAQFDIRFDERTSLLFGYGVDFVDADSSDPITGELQSKESTELHNYNASLVSKLTEQATAYITYAFSQSHSADTGGAMVPTELDDPQESELYEVGLKFSLIEDKLFMGTAFVDRSFTIRDITGISNKVEVNAFEFELNYQPNKNLWATFGYAYTDAQSSPGFFATPYTIDREDIAQAIMNAWELSTPVYITPIFRGNPSTDIVDLPGTPEHSFNGAINYEWDNGWGVQAVATITGPMKTGYDGFTFTFPDFLGIPGEFEANTVEIPWQHELDLTVFYKNNDWRYSLTVFNVTDEDNWDTPNSGYGNGSVVAREPVRMEFTVTKSW